MADEDQRRIMDEFSCIRVLFASIVIGMGTHLSALYNVWRIGQPITLLAWVQELGRAGRDGGASEACLFFKRSGAKWKPCMKHFCTSDRCLRLQIAFHFDPDVVEDAIWDALSTAGVEFCCAVCSEYEE